MVGTLAPFRAIPKILEQLESRAAELPVDSPPGARRPVQESLFTPPVEKILKALRGLKLDQLTPLDALNQLAALQEEAGRDRPRRSRRRPPPTGPDLFETAAGGDG